MKKMREKYFKWRLLGSVLNCKTEHPISEKAVCHTRNVIKKCADKNFIGLEGYLTEKNYKVYEIIG